MSSSSFLGNFIRPRVEAPPPPPPPPSPQGDTAEAQATRQKMEDAAAAERKSQGRASTILTSGQGDNTEAPVSKRVLLGT